jgi:arylsulfatase A-like enzyme
MNRRVWVIVAATAFVLAAALAVNLGGCGQRAAEYKSTATQAVQRLFTQYYMRNQRSAQESADATRTIADSDTIPAPAPTFGGLITKNIWESRGWYAPRIVPPKDAPNVLVIILDDVGFGASSSFGGLIPMPAQDALAKQGLRYVNFHTTALCSPTRAALITGHNHHDVGFGGIVEQAMGFPGYNTLIDKDTASIGRILQANGYATSWFGKDHNVPTWENTSVGPFDHWPIGQGFDYFYGFVNADMNQWAPSLYRNTTLVEPALGRPNYNLNIDLADDAVNWLKQIDQIDPTKKVFMYYAPGATHAPHQPTKEWIARFKGKFDFGWNAYRELVFKRQLAMGMIPKNAKLTPWPDDLLPRWDSLTPVQKKVYARQMEVYAAYLAETDYEIGRVIQAFKDTGRFKDTLTIYIDGDNGASAEGTLDGTVSEITDFNGIHLTAAQMLPYLDDWGGPKTYPLYAVPWAWALDTPFKWTKQVASYFGGTRNGMVVAWPHGIDDPGGTRFQFHHVIDVVPTILEAAGIRQPASVDGVKQRPIQGVSFAYTFQKKNADAPSQHHVQYFEMVANRALYKDGWIATTLPLVVPWNFTIGTTAQVMDPYRQAKWQLYKLDDDWTEFSDVSAQYPAKLKELQIEWERQASLNNVFPMSAVNYPRPFAARPSIIRGRTTFRYTTKIAALSPWNAPNFVNTSFRIVADVDVTADGRTGVLVTNGGRFGGIALYLLDGKPVFAYNRLALSLTKWRGPALSLGRHVISFDFKYSGPPLSAILKDPKASDFGQGGLGTLSVDGKTVDEHGIAATIPFIFPWDEGFAVGSAAVTAVCDDYTAPFEFSGRINSVTVSFPPAAPPSAAVRKYLARVMERIGAGIE